MYNLHCVSRTTNVICLVSRRALSLCDCGSCVGTGMEGMTTYTRTAYVLLRQLFLYFILYKFLTFFTFVQGFHQFFLRVLS